MMGGRCAEPLNGSRYRRLRPLGGPAATARRLGGDGGPQLTAPSQPSRTPTRTERRIIKVRVLRRWGPARIGYLLGLHPSTVHRVLTRYRMARLRWLDRPTGR